MSSQPSTIETPAQLTYHGRPPAAAVARLRVFDRGARLFRAVRAWAACWALAVVTVFVPLGHFFLVPGFLILGPVLAWREAHTARSLLSARGTCPACGHEQHFAVGGSAGGRHALRCAACRREIFLVEGAAPGM